MPTTYAIPDGRTVMAATLFTPTAGANTIVNTVNGVGFQPDLTWTKSRSNAQSHYLVDSVRGGTSLLRSETTSAESIYSSPPWVTSFNSNGYSTDTDSMVTTGYTYVGWQWKAGGAAVTNTAGSISSQVSANTTAGFSVVTYTGTGANATVGHGLGVAPSMVITKVRSTAGYSWTVGHTSIGWGNYLYLNLTAAQGTASNRWQNTAPTSTVFSVGDDGAVNGSGLSMVAYCYAPVAGYSAFGSYTGNGSADGPFVYLGFRPRFVMVKSATSIQDWKLLDTSRNSYNSTDSLLGANISSAEDTNALYNFDILSNGFKPRNTFGYANTSGATYIYAAFAENPFKYSNAR